MNLNIQLTPEDYVRANYLNMRPRPALKWAGYLMLTLTVIVLVFSSFSAISHHDDISVPIFLVCCLAYLAFFFGLRWPARLKKIFRQQKSLRSPHWVDVTNDWIFTKVDNGEIKLTWDHFIKWKENKDLFTLYQSDLMLHIFPKRCFASPEEVVQFRALLLEKIGHARP